MAEITPTNVVVSAPEENVLIAEAGLPPAVEQEVIPAPGRCEWVYRRTTGCFPRGSRCPSPIHNHKGQMLNFCQRHHKSAVAMSYRSGLLSDTVHNPNWFKFKYEKGVGLYEHRIHRLYSNQNLDRFDIQEYGEIEQLVLVQGKKRI